MNVNNVEKYSDLCHYLEKKYCDAHTKERRVTYLQKIKRAIKMQILPALYYLA